MDSSDLLDQTFARLANDTEFLAFKGLTPSSPIEDKVAYIQKEEQPDDITDATKLPRCLLFIRPGHYDYRSSVNYYDKLVVECYASDANVTRKMVAQLMNLLHEWAVPGGFTSRKAYETTFKTQTIGIKGHRIMFDVYNYVG